MKNLISSSRPARKVEPMPFEQNSEAITRLAELKLALDEAEKEFETARKPLIEKAREFWLELRRKHLGLSSVFSTGVNQEKALFTFCLPAKDFSKEEESLRDLLGKKFSKMFTARTQVFVNLVGVAPSSRRKVIAAIEKALIAEELPVDRMEIKEDLVPLKEMFDVRATLSINLDNEVEQVCPSKASVKV